MFPSSLRSQVVFAIFILLIKFAVAVITSLCTILRGCAHIPKLGCNAHRETSIQMMCIDI